MENKIIEILAEVKEDETLKSRLTLNSNIVDEVGLDSLEMINFILRVEEVFNKEIDYEKLELDHLSSINSFYGFIKTL